MMSKEQLLASFANYQGAVAEALEQVRKCIEADEFHNAGKLMTAVSTSQARMSIKVSSAMTVLADALAGEHQ